MKTTLLVAAGAAVASASLSETQTQFLFSRFVEKFDKTYQTKDMFNKYGVFKNNLDIIMTHNANPNKTFTMGVNQFADMTAEEFDKLNTYRSDENNTLKKTVAQSFPKPTGNVEIDWVKLGKVNKIKNQGSCGSCWAFSATSALESVVAITAASHDYPLNLLSEQHLVDCAGSEGNYGCNGGLMDRAYEYVIKKKQHLNSHYRYTGKDETCKFDESKPRQQMVAYTMVEKEHFVGAILQQPLAVAIHASSAAFQFYTSGIITASSGCGPGSPNHAVNAVALGTDSATGIDYYTIRNSWGTTWGDQGYVRVERAKNVCSVETDFGVAPRCGCH